MQRANRAIPGEVIPFMPEQIVNNDGTEKQDCEMNAAKRLSLCSKAGYDHQYMMEWLDTYKRLNQLHFQDPKGDGFLR